MTEVPKIVHHRLRAAMPAAELLEQMHPEADVLTAFAEQALSAPGERVYCSISRFAGIAGMWWHWRFRRLIFCRLMRSFDRKKKWEKRRASSRCSRARRR